MLKTGVDGVFEVFWGELSLMVVGLFWIDNSVIDVLPSAQHCFSFQYLFLVLASLSPRPCQQHNGGAIT